MLPCQRDLFALPDDLHYLNCASRALLLKTAEAAGIAGLRWQNAPDSLPKGGYFAPGEILRERAAALVNASPDDIAIIPAVSYGVAIAARALDWHPAQKVVMPKGEFPSNVYGWWAPSRDDRPRVQLVERPVGAENTAAAWNQALLDAIDADTAVVNISTVHWVDGLRFDVEAIGAKAREVGAMFIVDGTQSVGAEPFDMARIQPDLLVCAGYKWLMGPYQAGFAVVGDRLRNAWPFEHHWANRIGSDNPGATEYREGFRPGARRFDVGEHANPITLPILNEGMRQVLEWGLENIRDYCGDLMRPLEDLLADTEYSVIHPAERAAHIVGIRLPDEDRLVGVMEALVAANIRVSRRGDALRISPHLYNTAADVEALCRVLKAAI